MLRTPAHQTVLYPLAHTATNIQKWQKLPRIDLLHFHSGQTTRHLFECFFQRFIYFCFSPRNGIYVDTQCSSQVHIPVQLRAWSFLQTMADVTVEPQGSAAIWPLQHGLLLHSPAWPLLLRSVDHLAPVRGQSISSMPCRMTSNAAPTSTSTASHSL